MLSQIFSLLFSVLLTAFALAPWYVDQSLRFLMAKEIDVVMIVLTLLASVSVFLLVQDIGSRPASQSWSWLATLLMFGSWTGGVCLTFWTSVEPLWQRTVPGLIFALAGLWLPVLGWLPIWNISWSARAALLLALLLLQPFFPLRYKIQPLNPQGQFVVVKRSDLYKTTPSSAPVTAETPSPAQAAPVEAGNVVPMDEAWTLFSLHQGQAKKSAGSNPQEIVIDVSRGEPSRLWEIEWYRSQISIATDQPLVVSFRARATQPGKLGVRFQQNHEPWNTLGLDRNVDVGPEWQTYRLSGSARQGDKDSRLTFQLGGSPKTFTIADVRIEPAPLGPAKPQGGVAKLPPPNPAPPSPTALPTPPAPAKQPVLVERVPAGPSAPVVAGVPLAGWVLQAEKESGGATFSVQQEKPGFVRVKVPSSDPAGDWKVLLLREGLSLEQGKNYTVRLRARSDRPRTVRLVTSENAPPWSGMGLFESTQLTSDWQQSTFEFTAIKTGPCRLYVALAGAEATMDFAEIELTPKP